MQGLRGTEEEGISQPTCKPGAAAGLSEALTDVSLKAQTPARSQGMAVSYCRLKSAHSWINSPVLPAGLWVSEIN